MGLSLAITAAYVMLASGFLRSAVVVSTVLLLVFVVGTWFDVNYKLCKGLVIALSVMLSAAIVSGNAAVVGGSYCAVLMLSESAYLLLYLLFRGMNYEEMTSALVKALAGVARLATWMREGVLGTDTMKRVDDRS